MVLHSPGEVCLSRYNASEGLPALADPHDELVVHEAHVKYVEVLVKIWYDSVPPQILRRLQNLR
jgi:hypothetical protein